MNKDQVKGQTKQVIGKLRQVTGEVTNNEELANQGVADQIKGAVQETWGDLKDAADANANAHEAEHRRSATDTREHVANKVQELKEHVKEIINDTKKPS